jgi:hypothetical protein
MTHLYSSAEVEMPSVRFRLLACLAMLGAGFSGGKRVVSVFRDGESARLCALCTPSRQTPARSARVAPPRRWWWMRDAWLPPLSPLWRLPPTQSLPRAQICPSSHALRYRLPPRRHLFDHLFCRFTRQIDGDGAQADYHQCGQSGFLDGLVAPHHPHSSRRKVKSVPSTGKWFKIKCICAPFIRVLPIFKFTQ